MVLKYIRSLLKVVKQSSSGCRTFLKYMFMFATSPIGNAISYVVMTCAVLCFTSDNADNAGANY